MGLPELTAGPDDFFSFGPQLAEPAAMLVAMEVARRSDIDPCEAMAGARRWRREEEGRVGSGCCDRLVQLRMCGAADRRNHPAA